MNGWGLCFTSESGMFYLISILPFCSHLCCVEMSGAGHTGLTSVTYTHTPSLLEVIHFNRMITPAPVVLALEVVVCTATITKTSRTPQETAMAHASSPMSTAVAWWVRPPTLILSTPALAARSSKRVTFVARLNCVALQRRLYK